MGTVPSLPLPHAAGRCTEAGQVRGDLRGPQDGRRASVTRDPVPSHPTTESLAQRLASPRAGALTYRGTGSRRSPVGTAVAGSAPRAAEGLSGASQACGDAGARGSQSRAVRKCPEA